MDKSNQRREFPSEVVKACGFAQIPNAVLWKEMSLSYPAKILLIYMLSQPMEWIYYESKITEETGISKTTVNKALNTELIPCIDREYLGTGRYGNGFVVNFTKLYNKCIEIGTKKRETRSLENMHSSALKDFVRDTSGIVRKKDDVVPETITTNTHNNTVTTNTKKEYSTNNDESLDCSSFSLKTLSDASPYGSRPIDDKDGIGKEELVPPKKENIESKKNDFETFQQLSNKNKKDNKHLIVTYIIDSLFQSFTLKPETKTKCQRFLLSKPASELELLVLNKDKWKPWCQNISEHEGVKIAKNSDYGLPILCSGFIYNKFVAYIKSLQIFETEKFEQHKIVLLEKKNRERAKKRIEFVEQLSHAEKLQILQSFRFDMFENYYQIYEKEIEETAQTNRLRGIEDFEELYRILAHEYPLEYYQGRDVFLKRLDEIKRMPKKELKDILRTFNYQKAKLPYHRDNRDQINAILDSLSIIGNQDILCRIVFHDYPDDYYEHPKEADIDPDFANELMRSLSED